VPTDNETWVIENGDTVIRRKARDGIECLSSWETLVYCLWVADYGMRNAGDLNTAADIYPHFQLKAGRIAKTLSLQLTHEPSRCPRATLSESISIDSNRSVMRSGLPSRGDDMANPMPAHSSWHEAGI
jgi:hypothetical protein